jgi:acetolactate synthase-1/2/3 large subunit
MKVSEWIVSEIIKKGVTYLSTLQGGFSMYLNDAIGHSELKPIYFLSESGASFWAAGWAQYTNKMGVCVITSGLAQTNALSGVASAFSDYLPMMVISGDINSNLIYERDKKHLRQGGQQDVPIAKIVQSITKGVYVVDDVNQVRSIFYSYWELALTDPMGPIWLDIPLDMQQKELPDV